MEVSDFVKTLINALHFVVNVNYLLFIEIIKSSGTKAAFCLLFFDSEDIAFFHLDRIPSENIPFKKRHFM